MTILVYLLPVALFLGLVALAAFLWSIRSGQYDDLDGAAERILYDDDDDPPSSSSTSSPTSARYRERGRPDS